MFKSILTPTDGSPFSAAALEYALTLAQNYQGFIKALHVVDIRAVKGPFIRDISASMGLVPVIDYQPKVQEILEERGKIALDAVEKRCADAGVKCLREMTTGIISDEIRKAARTCDLIVMGQRGEHAEFGHIMLGSTLEATVRATNKPVLVTPDTHRPISRILMAYDQSYIANDALRVCRNLAAELKLPVVVLTVQDEKSDGDAILDEARQYLAPYELSVEYVHKKGDAPSVIFDSMDEFDCNLLIMGAYGRNRIVEIILGSSTSFILRKADFPVLLSR